MRHHSAAAMQKNVTHHAMIMIIFACCLFQYCWHSYIPTRVGLLAIAACCHFSAAALSSGGM
jgi:hypothetical protein